MYAIYVATKSTNVTGNKSNQSCKDLCTEMYKMFLKDMKKR